MSTASIDKLSYAQGTPDDDVRLCILGFGTRRHENPSSEDIKNILEYLEVSISNVDDNKFWYDAAMNFFTITEYYVSTLINTNNGELKEPLKVTVPISRENMWGWDYKSPIHPFNYAILGVKCANIWIRKNDIASFININKDDIINSRNDIDFSARFTDYKKSELIAIKNNPIINADMSGDLNVAIRMSWSM